MKKRSRIQKKPKPSQFDALEEKTLIPTLDEILESRAFVKDMVDELYRKGRPLYFSYYSKSSEQEVSD